MKRTIILIILGITLYATYTHAKTKNVYKAFDFFEFDGSVRHSSFWDTRQVVTESIEGFGIFYPKEKKPDICGNDINAAGQFDMLPIRTRLELKILGPSIKTAKSWGYIQTDFFGHPDIPSLVRLRKAFLQLEWNRIHLLAGQDWHPLYVQDAAAKTVSITKGFPIQCYGRQPQVRATFFLGDWRIITAITTQVDIVSDGPRGPSSEYLRDAIVPDLHGQIRWYLGKHFFGIAADWKRLKPRLSAISPQTAHVFKVNESIDSTTAIAYAVLNFDNWYLRSKFIYSENLRDLNQISGYAVKCRNECTGEQEYTNTRALSGWVDIVGTKWETLHPGLFVGYTKNIGSKDVLFRDAEGNPIIFARAPNLKYEARIAPRIRWDINSLTIGAEIEYDRAAYGTIGPKGEIENAVPVSNTELHIALFYYF